MQDCASSREMLRREEHSMQGRYCVSGVIISGEGEVSQETVYAVAAVKLAVLWPKLAGSMEGSVVRCVWLQFGSSLVRLRNSALDQLSWYRSEDQQAELCQVVWCSFTVVKYSARHTLQASLLL